MISIAYGEDRTTHMLMFGCMKTDDLVAEKAIYIKFYVDKPVEECMWNNFPEEDKHIINISTKIKEMALGI